MDCSRARVLRNAIDAVSGLETVSSPSSLQADVPVVRLTGGRRRAHVAESAPTELQ